MPLSKHVDDIRCISNVLHIFNPFRALHISTQCVFVRKNGHIKIILHESLESGYNLQSQMKTTSIDIPLILIYVIH